MRLFSRMYSAAQEPILRRILKLVMQDESRPFAFGNLSWRRLYDDMTESERRERQEADLPSTLPMHVHTPTRATWPCKRAWRRR